MDCTNCEKECAFVKSGFCDSDKNCPFYLESWWQLEGQQQPKLIKDCFPKKFGVEQNNMLHRFICLQQSVEQLRNKIVKLENKISLVVDKNAEMDIQSFKRIE